MSLPLATIRKAIPWYIKFGIKVIQAVLPFKYNLFANLGLFKHGRMDDPSYAMDTFKKHFGQVTLPAEGFTFLEIGPGDSLFSAIIAWSKGARTSYLIDHADFSSKDVGKYSKIIRILFGENFEVQNKITSVEDVKRVFNIHYLTNGIESLRGIPGNSVDVSFSNACMEHIPADEMGEYFKELKRVSKPNAISSHFIDFKDHLEYSLNNLRFGKDFWEKPIIKKANIYTNRLRLSDMVKLAEQGGFKCRVTGTENWPELPLSPSKFHSDFKSYNHQDLLVKEAWVRLE